MVDQRYGVGDLAKVIAEVSDSDIDRLIGEYDDSYGLVPSLRAGGEHREKVRYEARRRSGGRGERPDERHRASLADELHRGREAVGGPPQVVAEDSIEDSNGGFQVASHAMSRLHPTTVPRRAPLRRPASTLPGSPRSALERAYRAVRGADDPTCVLARKVPEHAGSHPSVTAAVASAIESQCRDHPRWTWWRLVRCTGELLIQRQIPGGVRIA